MVELPGTQAVPCRRNKGSLSLYSDEQESDKSAEEDLSKWLAEKQQQRVSPRRTARAPKTRLVASSGGSSSNEMTYDARAMNFTQPVGHASDSESYILSHPGEGS